MNSPIGLRGDFKAVPSIPANLTLEQIPMLFPKGFEDIIEYDIDSVSGNVIIMILNDSNRQNTIITLNENLFNPAKNGCTFPHFLIERSFKYPSIDYFTDTRDKFIFNQNELFYLVLQHRLCEFEKFKDAYGNLLNTDIKSVMRFISYMPSKAYNAIQKANNSFIVLSIFDEKTKELKKSLNSQCLGNILKTRNYHPIDLQKTLSSLPLHYSSESMGEHSKYVLHPYNSPLYRSVGYDVKLDAKGNPIAQSLFPAKQNIPARNKTHVISDAHEVFNFEPTSHFIQDYIPNLETRKYEPKDRCYRKAIVVIHPITDNNRFLFGEVDASVNFIKTDVIIRETISEQFEEVYVELNKTYQADSKGIINVGINIDNELLFLENCSSATLKHIQILGTLGVQKLVFEVVRLAGNARLDSNTGLKGVTTCRNNTGKINIPSLNLELKPDLVFGMNSFKAKGNGIILARAALAVELGLYRPKHSSGLLNTLNSKEINDASNALPEYSYIDNLGNKQTVQIGIVYARFTELCYLFKSFRPQTFSFEAGRVLNSLPDNRLFTNIWDNYVSKDYKEIVLELEKIQLDKKDIFNEGLPIYSVEQVNKHFTAKDLILNIRTATESESCLLDEEWNKGFFINLLNHNGKVIRIPCAKTLKMFCTQTESKMYMYPALLVLISRIINAIKSKQIQLLFPRTDTKYARNQTPVILYYKEIQGLLYSDEESAVMLVQKLSRPEIDGIAMKQSTDWILPDNTCVIMCNKTYKRAIKKALGDDYPLHELMHGFWGLHARAPYLWQEQSCPVKIWNQEDFRIFLHSKHGIKLEDYINTEYNNDVKIFSNNVLRKSQSDVDGDHAATFTPKGLEAQECIRTYNNPHVTQAEHDWIDAYIKGERSSDRDLIHADGQLVNHVYELYPVPLHTIPLPNKKFETGFDTFLYRAISAKGNIGVATNDGWVFNMLLDIYSSFAEQNSHKYQVSETSAVKSMYRLSLEQRNELSFSYTRALQDFVVRGVKHTANGSEDFEILFLRNFWKPDNSKDVFKLLTTELGLTHQLASRMIFIITWAQEMGFLLACSTFLKLYNKGTLPTTKDAILALEKHQEFIQANTYFGMLLEPLYNLRQQAKNYVENSKIAIKKSLETTVVVDPFAALLGL